MKIPLLDVNVLIALFWPGHGSHKAAQQWFAKHAGLPWATCSFTQAGFVRIISNPKMSTQTSTPKEAIRLLGFNLLHAHHVFWPDTLGFAETVTPFLPRLRGHQQVSDAYLLGLTKSYGGTLVTFDSGIATLAGDQASVELIG